MKITSSERARKTTIADIHDLATVPVWSNTDPNAAGLMGVERTHAYALAKRGDLPTIHLGRRVLVPVQPLLRLLGVEE